jgi:DNA-binding MarR family transcriptional regulator
MSYELRILTRPLTSAERQRIEAARRKLEDGRQERDIAIRDAFERRGNVGEIADAAGISRPTVYDILKRLEDEGSKR